MARIVAGVACSHVRPSGPQSTSERPGRTTGRGLFDGFERTKELLAEIDPDLIIEVYNDHGSAFSLQYIFTFGLGVAPEFKPADEGWGARPVPVVKGHPEFAWHLAES